MRSIISGPGLDDHPVRGKLRQHSPTLVCWDTEGGEQERGEGGREVNMMGWEGESGGRWEKRRRV